MKTLASKLTDTLKKNFWILQVEQDTSDATLSRYLFWTTKASATVTAWKDGRLELAINGVAINISAVSDWDALVKEVTAGLAA